jgi:uncharacterized protein (TIGR02284 family)
MDSSGIAKKLATLVQLDIDAVHAYDQAIANIQDDEIRAMITKFRNDHQRHIEELSPEIRALGETPPEYSPDFKGYLISGFTSLRSMTGMEGALKAMQANENFTNVKYHEAIKWQLIPPIMGIVERNFKDERLHLEYIENILELRSLEKK